MNEDLIRYDILTQDALRLMIAKLLDEVSRTGLPGEHHFFITFDTCAPNVTLSPRMKKKYPDEMTIVVQHRFWQMEVTEDRFQIGLSFDEIPETLVIPFAAIKGFYDPSVKFGLQFEVQVEEQTQSAPSLVDQPPAKSSAKSSAPDEKLKKKRQTVKEQKAKKELLEEKPVATKTGRDKKTSKPDQVPENQPDNETQAEPKNETGGAQVVSLDSFRKKK